MDYELEVVSESDKNKGSTFRSYKINDEHVIGVNKSEPFSIRFKNNTWQRIQIRISLDGTDLITGELASTKPTGRMWLVEARAELVLKAWPETNNGGAQFIFTTKEKGVAVNTHGVAVGIGILAAAVYIDAAPIHIIYNPITYKLPNYPYYTNYPNWYYGDSTTTNFKLGSSRNGYYGSGTTSACSLSALGEVHDGAAAMDFNNVKENLSVGAGEYTSQSVSSAIGLNKPVLDEIVQVRYVSCAKLSKLIEKQNMKTAPNPFPASLPEKRVNLKNVPRTKQTKKARVEVQRFV